MYPHQPGEHHADNDRDQRQSVILFSDDFVVQAENMLAYETRGRSMMLDCLRGHVVHVLNLAEMMFHLKKWGVYCSAASFFSQSS
jgi:hypothetical protein